MKTKDLVIMALFIAMSFILANIKFFNTVAMDSVPAFLALLIWKDYKASIIGGIGHIFTSLSSGFPFGLFTHFLIALLMFIMLYFAAKLIKKVKLVFLIIYIYAINVLIMPICIFIVLPFSLQLYITLVSSLSIAVTINLIIAYILAKFLKKANYNV